MFKKTIFFTALLLGLLYWINSTYFGAPKNAISFATTFSTKDLTTSSRIDVINKKTNESFYLTKIDNRWIIQKDRVNFIVPSPAVDSILLFMSGVNSDSIVTRKVDDWASFSIDEERRIEIQFTEKGIVLETFILGFGQHEVCLRLPKSNEVFLLNNLGLNEESFSFLSFRNQKVLDFQPEQIAKISLYRLDTLVWEKDSSGWLPESLMKIDDLLKQWSVVELKSFADHFDETEEDWQIQKLELMEEGGKVVTLECFFDSLTPKSFVFHSSTNSKNWFAVDSSKVYNDFFEFPEIEVK